jgi:hypothetical protein
MSTKAANTGNGYPSGMKNRIINGGMDISQRGTSFVGVNGNTYTLDRWRTNSLITGGVMTITQNSDTPTNLEFQNSLRVAVTTADTSVANTDCCAILQNVEGYNIRDLIGRTFTLSFWVRSTKTGVHHVALLGGLAYISAYTINVSNIWEFKTITVAGGLPTAGTWNYTNGGGLGVTWVLMAGTNFHTTTVGSWISGDVRCASNQVNCLDTIGNIFAITGVQLELGPVATPFEHRLYGAELALCQRYFQVLLSTTVNRYVNVGNIFTAVRTFIRVPYTCEMRTNPVIANNSVSLNINYAGVVQTSTTITVSYSFATSCGLDILTAGLTPGQCCHVDVNSGSVTVSAEL